MKYALHFGPEALHIELEGAFTFMDARIFHRMLKAINTHEARTTINLNIHHLKSIDSTALRLLMLAHDAAKKNRRLLVFQNPRGQVFNQLNEAARVNHLIIAA